MPAVTLSDSLLEARRLLQHHFGYDNFRPAQRRVIQSVLAGRDALAVLPTGGGKSICFQIPALVRGGLTIVISPLISLMQDQVAALTARGIAAAHLNSSLSTNQQRQVKDRLYGGELCLLYVAPERLERLAADVARSNLKISLLAVDEAHCITEWGHDFRPSYRKLRRARYVLGRPQTVALTGSATPQVREDIAAALGLRWPDVHLGSFDRPNLWFGTVRVRNEAERLQKLRELLRGEDRTAIVYAPTRNSTEAITRVLRHDGFLAAPYHAGLTKAGREATLRAFLHDDVEIIVATCAFGMGIDKPTVRLVVHWSMPPTPESYYQEAGRAGRDGAPARCILLWRPGDAKLHRQQLDVTFPPPELAERVWRQPDGARGIPGNVLDSIERLRAELHPERGPTDWRRIKARRAAAEARIDAMEHYALWRGCRRRVLIGYFGERLTTCSGCGSCRCTVGTRHESEEVRTRLTRLRTALAPQRAPWGGCVLDAPVLRRLAEQPPHSAAELADVPGVGAVLAERLGATMLNALGPSPAPAPPLVSDHDPCLQRLLAWRRETARSMGVPDYVVLTEATLRALAQSRPTTRAALVGQSGLGPRALSKWGSELLRILSEMPALAERSPSL